MFVHIKENFKDNTSNLGTSYQSLPQELQLKNDLIIY